MSILAIFSLAVALAMDAFAVAIGTGCCQARLCARQYLRMAGAFGFFQFFMPLAGWGLGISVRPLIETWDHWVAFALLAWIGGSMIHESFGDKEEKHTCCDATRGKTLLVLAVATSIDALAVGLSFAMLRVSPRGPSVVIGLVCAAMTIMGLGIGSRLAQATSIGRRAELAGGLVLIAIGVKILFEHNVLG